MVSAKDLPAMRTNPKFIFFTDFDGTITLKDSESYNLLVSRLYLFLVMFLISGGLDTDSFQAMISW